MESAHRLQAIPSFKTKSFLVDAPETWWKIVELEQLSNWCHSSSWWCWRNSWAYLVQRNIVSTSVLAHKYCNFCRHIFSISIARNSLNCIAFVTHSVLAHNFPQLWQIISVYDTFFFFQYTGIGGVNFTPNDYVTCFWLGGEAVFFVINTSVTTFPALIFQFPNLGRSLLGKGIWLWGVHEV